MDQSLPTMTLGIENDDQLLDAVRRFKVLRTFPHASDPSQLRLHAACLSLHQRGLVQAQRMDDRYWLWSLP